MLYDEKVRIGLGTRRVSERTGVPVLRQRPSRRAIYVLATAICLIVFYLTHSSPSFTRPQSWRTGTSPPGPVNSKNLPCRKIPGANDTVVVLKTGSTELKDKLPIHLKTTLQCYPNYLLFSDHEEMYEDEHIIDALEFVDPNTKASHADFELWRRLQKGGREALDAKELSGPTNAALDNFGHTKNPGWKLDKWKFLPMVNRTLAEYPDKKWYVFVEVDTYILWQTLLNYLNALDWQQPFYMGGQIWIADIVFGHGGTGFAVSRPAMEKVVKMFQEKQTEWETFTDAHWAGDCVLGKAFADSGTPLTKAWPIWQGDDVGNMDYARSGLWCAPTVSYHHLTPGVVESLWQFEQEWIEKTGDFSKSLHHRDMFAEYLLPRVAEPKKDWNNHADEDQGSVESLEQCQALCEKTETCLQYALSTDSRCLLGQKPNLGEKSKGMESGWIKERMQKFHDDQKVCGNSGDGWITHYV